MRAMPYIILGILAQLGQITSVLKVNRGCNQSLLRDVANNKRAYIFGSGEIYAYKVMSIF